MVKGSRPGLPARVLIVDDDTADVEALQALLREDGLEVDAARSAEDAIASFRKDTYWVVLADVQLPGDSGLDLVKTLRTEAPATAVVVMTGHASVTTAVLALKHGAVDYLKKPVNPSQLRKLVAQLVAERPAFLPNNLLAVENHGEEVFENMLARSQAMHDVFERISLVAQTEATVLVVGETGTGKELVARAIHNRSPRAEKPFIPVHTGAIPKDLIESELFGHEKGAFTGAVAAAEGKFGAAKGGTIFLDEVSTMSERAQVDLLRVLETFKYTRVGGKVEHTADVRVVCATNADLLQMSRENKFREDLYYRINIFPIHLPPLRERKEDIGLLADRFMRAAAERFKKELRTLPEETLRVLEVYPWAGNVRELRNFVEQAVLLEKSDRLEPELVSSLLNQRVISVRRDTTPLVPILVGAKVEEAERLLAIHTVEAYRGDRAAAARALGIGIDRLAQLLGDGAAAQPAAPSG
jgi:DNA-binding NtrC family response regulator